MAKRQRDKGMRRERQVVQLHVALGIHCERVPLSGASRYRDNGADVDVYWPNRDAAPLVCEVKARANGAGFTLLERWLSDADALFLIRDRAPPMVVLPWATYQRLLQQ